MSENPTLRFQVRDPQGNVYGPADVGMLREWIGQGRIVAGMHIADTAGGAWVEVSTHPALADLFQGLSGAAAVPLRVVSAAPRTEPVTRVVEQRGGPAVTVVVNPAAEGQVPGPGGDLGYATVGPKNHILAILSLIAGILGIAGMPCGLFCICIGGPYVVLIGGGAIVMGAIALAQIKGDAQRHTGRGLALVGIVLGAVSIVLYVLMYLGIFFWQMAHR